MGWIRGEDLLHNGIDERTVGDVFGSVSRGEDDPILVEGGLVSG